ncbi:DNA-directed RNA polymerase subunit omega [Clostridium acetobutylicum]|uniref:DNA-directed RNA polymerase subunit omega n=1 Tax=Clostridium acetobutylicum (strain ATCC 824 / DSM 792 / JCM 1419 / IAM 19013 / LMG 5710 / NBRC 13948 / NRRL B-527 / VKM B-1787 / 2291 / W) TaxID=272562 RepID=RPOZ_CLOAB|nr:MULTISPECIES: DNA-directed RNA polymerase subunit omega [Clostridium]Q97IC9.1 RecName: Full=DNA-directed RNA polymerase subunit omega; Short=RNAP omega subunit; AltName: Full=RNA polymerase omega subunit; AltName: Full=Transcriptase subunit omega [Clostridium acetobutylicum ATCC 824]AAK79685.1 RNA polymerase-associated protein RpoZ, omega subunit (YLOH B.subtilis ortholog) [Clostridium acetobutylicum ATCC 824]ADZ20769.1 DNA-directed RNA polymerase subunit omega [Clostridium acetobutylicum EA 
MNNSMISPSVVDLKAKTGDRYSLVVITSKRARQIIAGEEPLVDIESNKALTIAINEVDQDKIKFDLPIEGIN